MKNSIDRLIIIADNLSRERSLHDISLSDNSASLFTEICANDTDSWYTYLLDVIFYTSHNLPSSITNSANKIKYRANINLEHYISSYYTSPLRNLAVLSDTLEDITTNIITLCVNQDIINKSLVVLFVGYDELVNTDIKINDFTQRYKSNINLLISHGYKNFVIFNIPLVHESLSSNINDFNLQLMKMISELKTQASDVIIDILDTASTLRQLENTTEIDTETQNIILSKEAHIAIARNFFNNIFKKSYEFLLPEQILLELFKTGYANKISQNESSVFAWFYNKPWVKFAEANLEEIFTHADPKVKNRTFTILNSLGWIDQYGECISKNALLINASTTKNNKLIG